MEPHTLRASLYTSSAASGWPSVTSLEASVRSSPTSMAMLTLRGDLGLCGELLLCAVASEEGHMRSDGHTRAVSTLVGGLHARRHRGALEQRRAGASSISHPSGWRCAWRGAWLLSRR